MKSTRPAWRNWRTVEGPPPIVPITLWRGVSLWEGSSGLEDRFTVESVTSPSGLIHQLWNKGDHA
jgi:hypothetical protein